MSLDLARFHKTFFEESFENLDVMEQALLRLDVANFDGELINTIFRAAHSIKGGAATFGFTAIAGFTHHAETLLDRLRSGQRSLVQDDIDLLLRAGDVLRGLMLAARDGSETDLQQVASVQADLEAALGTGPARPAEPAIPPPAISSGWRIRFAPRPGLFRSGNDPLRIFRALAELGAVETELQLPVELSLADLDAENCHLSWTLTLAGDASREAVLDCFAWVEDECELAIEALPGAANASTELPVPATAATARPQLSLITGGKAEPARPERRSGERRESSEAAGSIRVSTDKIDALINLVGELVITQAMLAQTAAQLDPVSNEKLLSTLNQLDRNTRSLQESVMGIRMLPMDFVFSRFPRLVHDLAGKLGKQVRLVTVGESTELDKGVIEKIGDPLNHLVRNSLDHGLELPELRLAAGKPAEGSITLKASHQGGHIVIEVIDDGRGLDRDKLLAKARERGLAAPDSMSDAEVWKLIFAPGFSTAAEITDVSGRGVGMDVVKQNILSLGGQVEITSRAGVGMSVIIRLPLTLAILDGMSVAVGEEIFIIPLNAVVESLQPRQEDLKSVSGRGEVIRVRGEYIPLFGLRQIFQVPAKPGLDSTGVIVLMESEGRKIAVWVDELVGQQQVVIKSLDVNYRRIAGISGATIMGDGRVALIVDVGGLARTMTTAKAA